MTPEQEKALFRVAFKIWARNPIFWSVLLLTYFAVVTYAFVTGWGKP